MNAVYNIETALDSSLEDEHTNSNTSDDPHYKHRKSITVPGTSGFKNIGNTCYMNSALQCLMATDLLIAYLIKHEFRDDLRTGIVHLLASEKRRKLNIPTETDVCVNPGAIRKGFKNSITYNMYRIFTIMWGSNCIINPKSLKAVISDLNPVFSGYQQNDSQELLNFVLDRIHEETKTDVKTEITELDECSHKFNLQRIQYNKLLADENLTSEKRIEISEEFNRYRKNYQREDLIVKSLLFWKNYLQNNHSVITDIFTGLYLTEIECTECRNKVFVFDAFNTLSLAIPQTDQRDTTLNDCLKLFTESETLRDKNMYACSSCNKDTIAHKRQVLWHTPDRLVIQLKRFNNTGTYVSKNSKHVEFPIDDLSLDEFISEYNQKNDIFDLYAVVHHIGSLHGGHYIAYTKNPLTGEWYEYNDDDIVHIDSDQVHNEIIDNGGYILFYKKRFATTIEDSDTSSDDSDYE